LPFSIPWREGGERRYGDTCDPPGSPLPFGMGEGQGSHSLPEIQRKSGRALCPQRAAVLFFSLLIVIVIVILIGLAPFLHHMERGRGREAFATLAIGPSSPLPFGMGEGSRVRA